MAETHNIGIQTLGLTILLSLVLLGLYIVLTLVLLGPYSTNPSTAAANRNISTLVVLGQCVHRINPCIARPL